MTDNSRARQSIKIIAAGDLEPTDICDKNSLLESALHGIIVSCAREDLPRLMSAIMGEAEK